MGRLSPLPRPKFSSDCSEWEDSVRAIARRRRRTSDSRDWRRFFAWIPPWLYARMKMFDAEARETMRSQTYLEGRRKRREEQNVHVGSFVVRDGMFGEAPVGCGDSHAVHVGVQDNHAEAEAQRFDKKWKHRA